MPSSHSGSSHSSSSHSSSSRSSSHSSSSHSSSSWSSSSGSSRSSRSTGGPTRGFFGGLFENQETNDRRVSGHSESSRPRKKVYHSQYVRDGSMRGRVIERERVNQPDGYEPRKHYGVAPSTHYCLRHNYLYYPYAWTDEATGKSYEKGYYDEEGRYYEDVSFRSNGEYQNVLCKCEYCGTTTKLNWREGGALICSQCGGSMQIVSALDEYTQDPLYEKTRRYADYVDYADLGKLKKRAVIRRVLLYCGILALAALVLFFVFRKKSGRDPAQTVSNVEIFGRTVYLTRTEPGVYRITQDGTGDKKMTWDYGEDCYYERESDLYLWYNTDVTPNLWQYWYEPISGDYGDYGWMEYEPTGWYIEADAGEWIAVPPRYDLSPLWHLEIDPADFD